MSSSLNLLCNQLQDIKSCLFNAGATGNVYLALMFCSTTEWRWCHCVICTIMKRGQEPVTVFALLSNWACVLIESGLHYLTDPAAHRGLN